MKEDEKKQRLLKALIETTLLEEETKLLLREEDWQPFTGSIFGKIFIEPFTDIAKTAIHGIKKNAATLVSNVVKLAKQTGVALLPFVATSEINRIGEDEEKALKAKLAELDKEYGPVLARNFDTMRTRDIALLGFVLNPTMGVGVALSKRVPQVALDILDTFVHGDPNVGPLVSEYKNKFTELNKKVLPSAGGNLGMYGYAGGADYAGDGGFGESKKYRKYKNLLIKEQQPKQKNVGFTQQQLNKKADGDIKQFMQRPMVKQALQNSPMVKALQATAIDVVLNRAKKVGGFKKYDDFKNYIGPTEFAKFEKQAIPKEVKPEQLDDLHNAMIPEFKRAYLKVYTHELDQIAKQAPNFSEQINKAKKQLQQILSK